MSNYFVNCTVIFRQIPESPTPLSGVAKGEVHGPEQLERGSRRSDQTDGQASQGPCGAKENGDLQNGLPLRT